jgi:hypothetical protein
MSPFFFAILIFPFPYNSIPIKHSRFAMKLLVPQLHILSPFPISIINPYEPIHCCFIKIPKHHLPILEHLDSSAAHLAKLPSVTFIYLSSLHTLSPRIWLSLRRFEGVIKGFLKKEMSPFWN